MASEWRREGILTTFGSVVGLAFGPSVIAILAISPFIPPIEAEFGWSRVQVSLAATIVSYMVVFVSPLQGFLVDRFGPRKVILTSIPLFSLGLASLYFLPDSLPLYYTIWVLIPISSIGLWPLGYLQAVSQWFERKLGLALGCANAGIGVGSTLVPLIIAAFIATYDWRMAFLGLAAIVLFVTWPVTFFTIKEPAADAHHDPAFLARMNQGTVFGEAIKEPVFFMLCAAFFLLGLTASSLVTQQVPLLIEAGWSQTEASFVQALFGFALLFARVFIGFVIDHFFAPRVMQLVSVGGAIACIMYALAPQAGIVSAILLGFLLGAEFDVLAFLIKRYFGNVAYGRLYGVIFGVFYLGSGLGIVGLAAIRQASGNYDTGLYIAAGVLLSCVILTALFPPYRFENTLQPVE
jgi:MFS family permease